MVLNSTTYSFYNNICIFCFPVPNFSISNKIDFVTLSIFRDDYKKLIFSFLELNVFETGPEFLQRKLE